MKIHLVLALILLHPGAQAQSNADAERLRISKERAGIEAESSRNDAVCHAKFLVNSCLNDVKTKRREALSDLRRQEIALDDMARKVKGAAQLQKTEDKVSTQNQQIEADKRATALDESNARTAREKLKTENLSVGKAEIKARQDAAASRAASNRKKSEARSARQSASDEERRKYNAKIEKAQTRQSRFAADKANRAKRSSEPLPTPN